ncbi:hypothetical protein A2U01_0070879, partial [Trifolium medium]|nr:hypothetical protein [Trifolium medium]
VGTSLGQPEQQAEIVTDEGSGFETAAEEEKSQDKVATEEEELSGNGNEEVNVSEKTMSVDKEQSMSAEKVIPDDIVDVDDCDSIDQPLNKTFGGIAK